MRYTRLLLTVFVMVIIGCGESPMSPEKTIIGSWMPTDVQRTDEHGNVLGSPTITFKEDGKYLEDNHEMGTYSVSGNLITIVVTQRPGGVATIAFKLSEDNQHLTIFSNEGIGPFPGIYKKVS